MANMHVQKVTHAPNSVIPVERRRLSVALPWGRGEGGRLTVDAIFQLNSEISSAEQEVKHLQQSDSQKTHQQPAEAAATADGWSETWAWTSFTWMEKERGGWMNGWRDNEGRETKDREVWWSERLSSEWTWSHSEERGRRECRRGEERDDEEGGIGFPAKFIPRVPKMKKRDLLTQRSTETKR